jgi:uncharacterized protein
MILEALVTTLNEDGSANFAPMGPRVEPDFHSFVLRPFKSATTYENLKRHGEGVLHVTDDALMIARAAIGLDPQAETRPASLVRGRVIVGACRYHEFRVVEVDDREDRATLRCETVTSGTLREWFGFNRAKHAVIEAAILATRVGILPMDDIADELRRLARPVTKTGGPDEFEAFALLVEHVRWAAHSIGRTDLDFPAL